MGARIEATAVKQVFPDWPADGPIDLNIHDLPHASSTTEWWSTNGHCDVAGKRRFAYFAAFFRNVESYHPVTRAPRYVHSLTWALYDLTEQRSAFVSRVEPGAAQVALRRIQAGLGRGDARFDRALSEQLERGEVPEPDRVLAKPALVGQHRLELDFASDSLRKLNDGSYQLQLFDERRALGCKLRISPRRAATRHGDNGGVRGPEDEALFSYFVPGCDVSGQIIHRGVAHAVTRGQGWYDHQFGAGALDELDPAVGTSERGARWRARQVGWTWVSAQLEDGSALTFLPQQYVESGKSVGAQALTISERGEVQHFSDARLEPIEHWQSSQSFVEHPVRWRLQIPAARIDLDVRAAFADQEVISALACSSFYAGRVELSGTRDGRALRGVGFVERSGFGRTGDMPGMLEQVDKLVRIKVRELVPDQPAFEQAAYLLTTVDKPHYMHGVDVQQYTRAHLEPIRKISDRGGDAWRCYAIQACIDVVGGSARDFSRWIAVPELLQAGALILADVENKTKVSRGGEPAHVLYGEAQAINSGTAAFFLGAPLIRDSNLADRQIVALYELYFDGLRASHAGQALDLDGFMPLMQRAIESDELAQELVGRVRAVHRLKTGVPVGCLARIGALAGGGTEQQVEALGRFFEDIGRVFAVGDEILRLQQDVMLGRITMPVARGMTKLPTAERRWLFDTLRSRTCGAQVAEVLRGCGAVSACLSEASRIGEASWARLSPLLEDSLAKMTLRAFTLYASDRAA
jgi:predicted secreted hydrolase/geranylgeranyl pyrophosphate synthase